jgi:TonB-linked SusC/RagA family outer membrane protein
MSAILQRTLIAFSVLLCGLLQAQDLTVSGTVSDPSGLPLPGVNVKVKNAKKGVQTDLDGKYAIKSAIGNVLVFSFLGFDSQEIKVTGPVHNVRFAENAIELDNVVVNALGVEMKKNQVGSAYSKVKGNTLVTSGETSVLKALSAKASNVNIVSNSGDPGSGAYIQIRGQNSITGSTQPLFVVDGIPVSKDEIGSTVDGVGQQNRLSDINPNDIESVQVFKGVSAAALWGYQAANGVVLIKTKKGKKGKINVTTNTSISYDQVNVRMDLQDRFGQGSGGVWKRNNANSWGDQIDTRSGSSDVYNTTGSYFVADNGTVYYPITAKNSRANYNRSNMDAAIGKGSVLDNHIGISGGGENTTFYLGLGSTRQTGIVRSSTYERTSLDFSSESKIAEKTTFKTKVSFSAIRSNRVQQGSNLSGLMLGLYRTPADFNNADFSGTRYNADGVPWYNSQRAYRQDIGTYNYGADNSDLNPSYNNPLWTTDRQFNPNKVNRFVVGSELKHTVNDWLTLLGRVGLDGYSDSRITMFPMSSSENSGNGSASQNVINYFRYNVDFMAMGDTKVDKNIGMNYLVGMNLSETNYDQSGGSYKNFLYDTNTFSYENAVLNDKTVFLNRTYSRLMGFYFSSAFDYKNYLFLTLGGRFETTSTYDPNLGYYFYPSVETAYKFTTHFNNGLKKVISDGKLRATFGQIASIPDPYRGTTYFGSAAGAEGWGCYYDSVAYAGSFMRSGTKGNGYLKPEIKTEVELGIDFELFQRIRVGATYYTNQTKNLLVDVPLNGSSTFSSMYGNFATIQNKGFEIEWDATVYKSDELKWNVYGNWSINRNLVSALEGTNSLFLDGFAGTSSRAVLGEPLGVLWGGKFARNADGSLILNANGFPTVQANEGIIGNPNPNWRGGFGTSVEYKGLKVSTLFDASVGGQLWDGTNGALNNFGRTWETANVVTPTQTVIDNNGDSYPAGTAVRGNIVDFGGGPVLLNQSWYQGLGGGFGPVAEQFVKSASWVKWRELTLSYKLSVTKLKIGLESVTFSATGRNLWLWTEAKDLGQDPETNLTGNSNGRGLQYFNHPNTKSYVFSVNLKF